MRFGQRTEEMDKSSRQRDIDRLEKKREDLELCMAGNPVSKKWQEINIQLTNVKGELQAIRNRMKYPDGMTHVTGERHPDA